MKLIIYSIIFGFLALVLSSVILGMAGDIIYGMIGEEDGDIILGLGIFVITIIGFFSPGLYVLNKIYEKSKKENIEKTRYTI